MIAGALLQHFWWGSVFIVTLPLAVVAFLLAVRFVPAHVNETTEPVDNLGGILSALLVGALVLGINFASVPDKGTLAISLLIIAAAATAVFVIRQRRAQNPLYDLDVAARPTFWVAALAGIIVFGSLMGAMFIGQQYLQNVLGYSSLQAGAAIIPAAAVMVIVAPRSAKLVEARGARFTLLCGYVFCFLGFATMLLLWKEDSNYGVIALGYIFVGAGVGLAGTPASHSLTGSVPVKRAGMASGTADLQRDLGGAIMQSFFGAAAHRGVRVGVQQADRIVPRGGVDQYQHAERADEVVRKRGRPRDASPGPIPTADHLRGAPVVPRRRELGLLCGHGRGDRRSRGRVLPLPQARQGTSASRAVPRTGPRF